MFESLSVPRRPNWKLRMVVAAIVPALVWGIVWLLRMTQMPLTSYGGPLPPLSQEQSQLAERLSAHVKYLSVTIGERSIPRAGSLKATTNYLRSNLLQAGYSVQEHTYSVAGQEVSKIEADLPGSDSATGTIIVGAHYDSVAGTVGANDNATGVAAVLEWRDSCERASWAGRCASCFSSTKSPRTSKLTTWEAWPMLVNSAVKAYLSRP